MPYRKAEVVRIVAQHTALFGTEDGRRRILDYICADLNQQDDGNWGKLKKPPPRGIPADTIVWKPTGDHVDVLSDTGPVWIERGLIKDSWKWIPAEPVDDEEPEPDEPDDTEPTEPDGDIANLLVLQTRVAALEKLHKEVNTQLGSINKSIKELSERPTGGLVSHTHDVTVARYLTGTTGEPKV
jgi:hypothetical protein